MTEFEEVIGSNWYDLALHHIIYETAIFVGTRVQKGA
jgi:hypothetical protein